MHITPLHAEHEKLGAKMCPFAGYSMPVHYKDGILKEHQWVRAHAGIFDVSHMGQATLTGKGVDALLSTLTPSDFTTLAVGKARYSVLTNEQGGIIDDLIAVRTAEDAFFIVFNAGCKEKDMAWVTEHLGADHRLTLLDDIALIAIQGPEAEAVLAEFIEQDIAALGYMHAGMYTLKPLPPQVVNTEVFVSRTGYTGEDGFEVSLPASLAPLFWARLLEDERVKPIGLGARDSLRLEAGYPLYGHDLTDETSPVEAGIGWVVSKGHDGFTGAERILKEKAQGATRKRVGVRLTGKGVMREGDTVLSEDGKPLGTLTSGGFAPSLQCAVGMAYVPGNDNAPGDKVTVEVRGRKLPAELVSMPFITTHTKKS